MELLFVLVAVFVTLGLLIWLGSNSGRNKPLDQDWQKQPRRPSTPAPKRPPPDRAPSPAGKAYGQSKTLAAFTAETAHALKERKTLKGRAYVIDGDTLKIQKTQIRLFGVDAPEMNHPFGKRAKFAMMALCKNQTVTAEITDIDDHGRTVAKCYLDDGRDLSAELVKQGLALDWPKYSGGVYQAMETPDARKKLWLAAARQRGHMHVWDRFDAREAAKRRG